MRILIIAALVATSLTGCTRWYMNSHLNDAYRAYDKGDCETVMLRLSQVERESRTRPYVLPEVSLLRGQCLERQQLFVDAAQTYSFIITQYPYSEYAYRARARLDTLQQGGHIHEGAPAQTFPAPR
ncbi:tetratricopeptide repeat protein [Pseudomonas sp. HR96]|uniref:tetratricopeptide repeat protein n=1 Tax=Pseudomonas sp. HR96 TaxID=1027966 RepID=UPI002A748200|nr:tetratricopeptide repeat protein [Pseudomonas sp. HR96]WPO99132.1 tetratricopeptide repeat protein [Pseudomonas sp. HR96]